MNARRNDSDSRDEEVAAIRKEPRRRGLLVPTTTSDQYRYIHHDQEVLNTIQENGGALEAAGVLFGQVEKRYWRLAGVLYEIDRTEAYGHAGYDSFQHFVQDELGMAYDQARQLVQTYWTLRGLGVDSKQLEDLGWT